MKKATELEEMFDISSERIKEIDELASAGILEGNPVRTVTGPGRPPLSNEPIVQVAFKESASIVKSIDARSAQLGLKRSEYLRQLVENDLRCSGLA